MKEKVNVLEGEKLFPESFFLFLATLAAAAAASQRSNEGMNGLQYREVCIQQSFFMICPPFTIGKLRWKLSSYTLIDNILFTSIHSPTLPIENVRHSSDGCCCCMCH